MLFFLRLMTVLLKSRDSFSAIAKRFVNIILVVFILNKINVDIFG